MDEVVMGTKSPVAVTDVAALVARYSEQIQATFKTAKELRTRIADGEAKVGHIKKMLSEKAPVPQTWDDVEKADAKLAALRGELREQDALLCMGMGAALAAALGESIADFSREDGWQPPRGSVLRIYMPGLLNLAMELQGKGK